MESLVRLILEGIVDHPEAITIEAAESQYGYLTITASVHPEDMGKVIGKNGKVIAAIRKLLKVRAMKLGKRFQFTLVDPQQTDSQLQDQE